jgi:hypothetical protein
MHDILALGILVADELESIRMRAVDRQFYRVLHKHQVLLVKRRHVVEVENLEVEILSFVRDADDRAAIARPVHPAARADDDLRLDPGLAPLSRSPSIVSGCASLACAAGCGGWDGEAQV